MLDRTKAGWHVLEAIWANKTGQITLPRIAHYCPTWQCNQKCESCSVWKRNDTDQLDLNQATGMFSQLACLDVVKIVGGEAFTRDDLPELCGEIIRMVRPYILQIVTNGSMTDRIVNFMRKIGSPRIQLRVSLSGIGKTHERLTGGAPYEMVHKTLVKLAALRKKIGFGLGINYRLSDDTVDDLEEALRIYNNLGIDLVPGIHYRPFLQDVDVFNTTFSHDHVKGKDKIIKAFTDIPVQRSNMSRLETTFLGRTTLDSAKRWLDAPKQVQPFGCRELRNLTYILPNGDLILCGLRHTVAANLAKQDLRSFWFSPEMENYRRQVDLCPGCPQAAIEIFSRLYLGKF